MLSFNSSVYNAPSGVASSLHSANASVGPTEDVDDITKIYELPQTNRFLYTSLQKRKIEELKRNPECMGIALAKKNGLPYPVYVVRKVIKARSRWDLEHNGGRKRPEWGKEKYEYYAMSLNEDKVLGRAEATHGGSCFELLQNYTQKDYDPSNALELGSGNIGRSRVPKEIGNIGVILLKSMVQKQLENEEKISLWAEGGTAPYYYKLGFRIDAKDESREQFHATIARVAQNHIGSHDWGLGIGMELSEKAKGLWAKAIAENPIGFPTQLPTPRL